jgi:hypothetical protein
MQFHYKEEQLQKCKPLNNNGDICIQIEEIILSNHYIIQYR